jgi:hypothetical protein
MPWHGRYGGAKSVLSALFKLCQKVLASVQTFLVCSLGNLAPFSQLDPMDLVPATR